MFLFLAIDSMGTIKVAVSKGTASKFINLLENSSDNCLGVDSPFFSTIVLFKNLPFPWVSEGFLEGFLETMEMEATPRNCTQQLARAAVHRSEAARSVRAPFRARRENIVAMRLVPDARCDGN